MSSVPAKIIVFCIVSHTAFPGEKINSLLGILPDKRAQVGIYVEGPNDVNFLIRVSRLYRSDDESLIDLDDDCRVVFVPTGGGNLKHWVNQRYLANAGLVEVHIYDADDEQEPPYQAEIDAVNARRNQDIGFITVRREMENYLHADCIRDEFGANLNITSWSDVPDLVAEHVHVASESPRLWAELGDDKQSEKASRARKRLNTAAASKMTLDQLREVDADSEVLTWFHAIRDRTR